MRARVSQTTLKRVTKLDAPLREELNRAAYVIAMYQGIDALNDSQRAQFTRAQQTILSWPSIIGVDEWEAIAVSSQQNLVDSSYEDRADRSPTVTTPEPDRQAEHQEAYRKYHEQTKLGSLDYVRHKEAQIKERTRKERIIR